MNKEEKAKKFLSEEYPKYKNKYLLMLDFKTTANFSGDIIGKGGIQNINDERLIEYIEAGDIYKFVQSVFKNIDPLLKFYYDDDLEEWKISERLNISSRTFYNRKSKALKDFYDLGNLFLKLN